MTKGPAGISGFVANVTPTVFVGEDAARLGRALAAVPQNGQCLVGVMVGDPEDPVVSAAAAEMAGELWPWAGPAAVVVAAQVGAADAGL